MRIRINITIIVLFFLLLVVMLLRTNTSDDAFSSVDNRRLAASPFTTGAKGDNFNRQVDSYLNDRIGFREKFICLNSRIDYYLFSKSPNAKVIIGERGFLFYNGENAGDGISMSEYIGGDRYTDDQLSQIAEELTKAKKYLEQKGCEFIVFIAPNKSRVYSEYMPDVLKRARISDKCQTDQIVDYLKANTGIRVVYPYEELKDYMNRHPDEPLYYYSDTHWNDLGAYIGAKALLAELGINIPEPEEVPRVLTERTYGDLYGMTALGKYPGDKDFSWIFTGIPDEEMEVIIEEDVGDIKYRNSGKDERRLFVNRDSFCSGMKNILGSEFNDVYLLHTVKYDPDVINEYDPDIYVYELVERYDNNLLAPAIIPE